MNRGRVATSTPLITVNGTFFPISLLLLHGNFGGFLLYGKNKQILPLVIFRLILSLCSFNSMAYHFKYLLDIRSCYFPEKKKKKRDIYSTSAMF